MVKTAVGAPGKFSPGPCIYWIFAFTHGITKKSIGKNEVVGKRMLQYLNEQNKGEAKSDRIKLYKMFCVTQEEYYSAPYRDTSEL